MSRGLGRDVRSRPNLGQSTVEFALILPLVFAVFWLGLECLLLGRDTLLVQHAAREAARITAVGGSVDDAIAGARSRSGLGSDVLFQLSAGSEAGSDAIATATLAESRRLPMIGRLAPRLRLEATVTMRVEGLPPNR